MNIYDEAKNNVEELVSQTDKEYIYQDEINGYKHSLFDFIERAKKVEKLLELYRQRFCFLNFDEDKGLREIKALEEELK